MSATDLPSAQTDASAVNGAHETNTASPLRWIDWIWRIRGQLDLPAEQSASTVIDRIVPLFDAPGTTHERAGNMLLFAKKDPPAQDRLAVFDAGLLTIADQGDRPCLRYELSSRFLLACFLAPFLFLAFGQLGITAAEYEKAKSEAATAEKAKDKSKVKEKVKKEIVLNPIDIALGAPAPKTRKEMKAEKEKEEKEPPSAKPAYVFAGIFAFLYVLGRMLEERLARSLFRKQLLN